MEKKSFWGSMLSVGGVSPGLKVDALIVGGGGGFLSWVTMEAVSQVMTVAGLGLLVIVTLLRCLLMWQKFRRRAMPDWDGKD